MKNHTSSDADSRHSDVLKTSSARGKKAFSEQRLVAPSKRHTAHSGTTLIRILLIGDSEGMQSVLDGLRRGGFELVWEYVKTEAEFAQAVKHRSWDIVIAQHSMRACDSIPALRVLKRQQIDLPFIIISSDPVGESAVAAMRAGAHDFLCKKSLSALSATVERELRAAQLRRKVENDRVRVEEELRRSRDFLQMAVRKRTAELEKKEARLSAEIAERKRVETALSEVFEQMESRHFEKRDEIESVKSHREHLSVELLKISEGEKQTISQELHDGLCQHLAGTALLGSLLHRRMSAKGDPETNTVHEICTLLNTGVADARSLSHELHPVLAGGDGLMEALFGLAQTTGKAFGIDCKFQCDDSLLIPNQSVATHLFRIAQEAVENAATHARAQHIVLTLKEVRRQVILTIEDDGVGIAQPPPAEGMGLRLLRYRASIIGGTCEVGPAEGRGTVVRVKVPIS